MKLNYKFKNFLKSTEEQLLNKSLCMILMAGLGGAIHAQSTYTFIAAGATGRFGPTQSQLNTAYASTNLSGLVGSSNGVQSFTLNGGVYRITAIGAHGGNNSTNNGGMGASMQGDFTLTGTTVLKIIVGQKGEDLSLDNNTGGGGGSFVWINGQTTPLVVAGGGGGAGSSAVSSGATAPGFHAVITTSGTIGGYSSGAPGVNGNGANPGGAGWYSDGANYQGASCTAKCTGNTAGLTVGGASPTTAIVYHGCAGTSDTGDGGFGGGSGGNGNCTTSFGAGGGGGYSGGVGQAGASGIAAGGGGGGSFNAGINQVNTASVSVGHGTVIIQELCNISLTASGSNSLNPSICAGQSVTLTTDGVSNYAWSTGNTTSSVIVVSPSSTTIYTLSALSSSNCTASRSITVTVSSGLPALTITNTPNTMCLGKTATLTAGGALTYTWSGGSVPVVNGQSFLPNATTTYTVVGQNGCGISTATTMITIAPLVVTASTSSGLICSGTTATLTGVSSVSGYTWYPLNASGNPMVVSPVANTVYTVAASDGTCFGTATVAVNTNPIPVISIAASNSLVCEGALVTMTASGGLTYTWTTPNSNGATISDNPTGPTLYNVMGSNALGCSSQASQIVITQTAPLVTVVASKTIVCSGGQVTLTASGANSYNWTSGPATSVYQVNPTGATVYTVTGTGSNNCTATKTININTLSANVSVSSASASICPGGSTTLTASGANSYSWTGIPSSNGVAVVSPGSTTIFSVTATATVPGLSCSTSSNISIMVFDNPTVSIVASRSVVCKADAPVTLTGTGAVTYAWSTNTTSAAISVHPLVTTTYSVVGTDVNGCQNTKSIQIVVNTCNSVGELSGAEKGLTVYPNPSNGMFEIISETDMDLMIVNELGQQIRTIKLSSQNNHTVRVDDLSNGVYFIVGQNNGINQKVIISK